MSIQMVKDAIKTGFEPAYILADSWFMRNNFVSEIKKIKIRYAKKLHVIGLMKTNRSIMINGIKKTASWCQFISKKISDFAKNKNVINWLSG